MALLFGKWLKRIWRRARLCFYFELTCETRVCVALQNIH